MKKFLSILLTVAMVLSMLCLPAVAGNTDPNPYGFGAAPDGHTPEGTPITSLDGITDMAGSYYLTANIEIDLEGVTGALIDDTFTGTLDGNGKKITFTNSAAFSASKGLIFNYLDDGATIKNLVVENASYTVTGGGSQNGIFANRAVSGTVTFKNIAVTGANLIDAGNGAKNFGGYVGDVRSNMVVEDCSFEGTMDCNTTATKTSAMSLRVGCFFGTLRTNACNVEMTNCHTIAGTVVKDFIGAAGFIGDPQGEAHTISFVNCTNNANLTNAGTKYTAGFIGKINTGSASFVNCVNNGNVPQGTIVGGFIGDNGTTGTLTFTNCVNNGDIETKVAQPAGGFLGRVGGALNATFTNCVNTGNITSVGSAGGLVGNTSGAGSSFTYTNCINVGNISAGTYAGGIQGGNSGSAGTYKFDGCVNAGTVEALAHRAAGIVAQTYIDSNCTIQNCINFGDVSNLTEKDTVEADLASPQIYDAAAFIGMAQITLNEDTEEPNAEVILQNNYNFGTITGWDYVATTEMVEEVETVTAITATKRATNQLYDADWVKNPTTVENNVDVPTSGSTAIAVDSALLHVLDGARIRVALADQADSGLRYDIATNETLLDKLAASANDGGLGYTVTVGSVFAKADTLGNATSFLGINAVSAVHQNLADVAFKADGTYSAALTGFAPEQYTQNFVCGGFINVTIGGTTYTIHSMAGDVRSVAQVANAALGDTTVNYSAYTEILNTFAGN
ncbi:MAG: hypothetical protein IJD75_01125 [Clostridia bacterium]|nr:hypothetical protein [Clostridia bacterium]